MSCRSLDSSLLHEEALSRGRTCWGRRADLRRSPIGRREPQAFVAKSMVHETGPRAQRAVQRSLLPKGSDMPRVHIPPTGETQRDTHTTQHTHATQPASPTWASCVCVCVRVRGRGFTRSKCTFCNRLFKLGDKHARTHAGRTGTLPHTRHGFHIGYPSGRSWCRSGRWLRSAVVHEQRSASPKGAIPHV